MKWDVIIERRRDPNNPNHTHSVGIILRITFGRHNNFVESALLITDDESPLPQLPGEKQMVFIATFGTTSGNNNARFISIQIPV